jgi:ribonuclease T1
VPSSKGDWRRAGSVRLVLDYSGNVTSTQTTDPFGAIQQQSGSPFPFGFSGQQTDPETGLQYLRARYYDPSNGRFLSQDPLAGLLPNPLSQHRYVYGLDNPLTFGDPTGKCDVNDGADAPDICTGPGNQPYQTSTPASEPPPTDPETGLPTTDPVQYPILSNPEVEQTLRRIYGCSPLKYPQDGIIWENRRGDLPSQPLGYYREYTVDTPGAPNRAQRRIVTGANGEFWYTNDHYTNLTLFDPSSLISSLSTCSGGAGP